MSFGKKKSATSQGTGIAGFMEGVLAAQTPAPAVTSPATQAAPKNASNIYTSRKKGTTTSFAGLYTQQAATARKTLLGQ